MAYEFKIRRLVEFSDTDMAGIVHHAVYFRYMESAEHAFFRSLGLTVAPPKNSTSVGWPRVHTEADFSAPLRFEDEVEIHLLVTEKKSKALTYAFRLRKLNTAEPYAVVCIKMVGGKMKAANIPKEIADKISVAPKKLLKS
jgi:YbgC/YbaW family acyl-CoA thioester hydrolase